MATQYAADLIGISDMAGAIEPGKWADLIAVAGDPLQNIRLLEDVKFVMKGGSPSSRRGRAGPARREGSR